MLVTRQVWSKRLPVGQTCNKTAMGKSKGNAKPVMTPQVDVEATATSSETEVGRFSHTHTVMCTGGMYMGRRKPESTDSARSYSVAHWHLRLLLLRWVWNFLFCWDEEILN